MTTHDTTSPNDAHWYIFPLGEQKVEELGLAVSGAVELVCEDGQKRSLLPITCHDIRRLMGNHRLVFSVYVRLGADWPVILFPLSPPK